MAKANTTELFNCSREDFYKIIADFDKYSEFLSEVKSCKVVRTEAGKKLVEFQVSLIKSFSYNIWVTEDKPGHMSWEYASGDVFKTMKGSWKLEDEAGKCRATYNVEATFGVFVPGPLANALVTVNLPNMMSSYQKRVKQIYGK